MTRPTLLVTGAAGASKVVIETPEHESVLMGGCSRAKAVVSTVCLLATYACA